MDSARVKSKLFFVLLIGGFLLPCSGGLDVKEFLPKEPLTTRRIVEDVLEYFQEEDPRGIPVVNVPEVLDLGGPFATTMMTLGNVSLSGHSDISLEYVDVNLEKLQFQVRLNIPHLEILGTYDWPGWFFSSAGELNITFINLDVGAICDFGVDDDGIIQLINMEIIFEKEYFVPNMTGLAAQHSLMVLAADTFFDTFIVPILQGTIRTKGMTAINERLRDRLAEKLFPVDISPVDYSIAKLRSDIVRERNLDPLVVGEKEVNYMAMSLVLKNIELRGLSSLHRSHLIRTEFVDNRIYLTIEIGTQKLRGSMDWSVYSTLFPLGSGHADFIIDSLKVSVEVQQDADIRHPPILRRIDVQLGNVGLRSRGERIVDYLLEGIVNILPNIFRNLIIDKKIEEVLSKRIQERFNTVNLQLILFEKLNKIENT